MFMFMLKLSAAAYRCTEHFETLWYRCIFCNSQQEGRQSLNECDDCSR